MGQTPIFALIIGRDYPISPSPPPPLNPLQPEAAAMAELLNIDEKKGGTIT